MNVPAIFGSLAILAMFALAIFGYIANICILVAHHEIINTLFVLRVVGIFMAPFGAVLGFF